MNSTSPALAAARAKERGDGPRRACFDECIKDFSKYANTAVLSARKSAQKSKWPLLSALASKISGEKGNKRRVSG